jgi:hypothetical protein
MSVPRILGSEDNMEKEEILNRAQQGKDDEYQQAIENRALIAGTAAAAIAMAVIYIILTVNQPDATVRFFGSEVHVGTLIIMPAFFGTMFYSWAKYIRLKQKRYLVIGLISVFAVVILIMRLCGMFGGFHG